MVDTSYSVVLSGEAGQGLKAIEGLSMHLLRDNGYHAFLSKEVMSRVRGGNNTTEILVTSNGANAYVDRIDAVIVLSRNGLARIADRIDDDTVLIGDGDYLSSSTKGIAKPIPIDERMKELGKRIYANVYMTGILAGMFDCDESGIVGELQKKFASKGDEVVQKNIQAFRMGMEDCGALDIHVSIPRDPAVRKTTVVSGSQAVGIGAIAGGLDFISSYPMSPSTGVLIYLANHAREYGIVVEQAEDEIAAMNMMLGAWYTGSRAMVTTSGGGFSLMQEGLSLAGMIESPAVIHLAQRPGPATGLPTRTEQGDLNLALYSGHGEFPRIIYAPGTALQAIQLTYRAFEQADTYQVPVFLLTDQYLLDSESMVAPVDFSSMPIHRRFIKTDKDYRRFALTDSGISPRGIPGYGEGFVCLDSDEHTEEGRITESFDVRKAMEDKRLKKLDGLEDLEPEIIGAEDYRTLIVGWGSSYSIIKEALQRLGRDDVAFAFFGQLYPVPKTAKKILAKAKRRILVENNATGQFGMLLRGTLLQDFDARILQYNGMQFSVENLARRIEEVL